MGMDDNRWPFAWTTLIEDVTRESQFDTWFWLTLPIETLLVELETRAKMFILEV